MAWVLLAVLGVASVLATVTLWAAVALGKRSDEDWEKAWAARQAAEATEEEEGLVPPPI